MYRSRYVEYRDLEKALQAEVLRVLSDGAVGAVSKGVAIRDLVDSLTKISNVLNILKYHRDEEIEDALETNP